MPEEVPEPFADFIMEFQALDLPFPEDVEQSRAIRSEQGRCVFFTFLQDMDPPPHSHGPQRGAVVEGEIVFTIGGETRRYGPGDSYDIGAGVEHGARIMAGTRVIDVLAEPDRYALRG